MSASPAEAAHAVLEWAPLVMRAIRAYMRQQRSGGLSVPQFRALVFIDRHAGASLSDLAEHLGVTLASMTRVVDTLESQGWVTRERDVEDRRRIRMSLTDQGHTLMVRSRRATLEHLTDRFGTLSVRQCQTVIEAMRIMHPLFHVGDTASTDRER